MAMRANIESTKGNTTRKGEKQNDELHRKSRPHKKD